MEKSEVRKMEEEKDLFSLGSVFDSFDREGRMGFELTGFVATIAIEDCKEQYDLLEDFLLWKDETGAGGQEFKKLTQESFIDEIYPSIMHAGFALGYIYGQNFDTPNKYAVATIKKLKERMLEEEVLTFYGRNGGKS